MTIVATNIGIGDETCGEVIVVFPSEIKGGWESVANVTGWAKSLTDDLFVGLTRPSGEFFWGDPVGRLGFDDLIKRVASESLNEDTGEGIGGGEDFGRMMG